MNVKKIETLIDGDGLDTQLQAQLLKLWADNDENIKSLKDAEFLTPTDWKGIASKLQEEGGNAKLLEVVNSLAQ